jgi:hypothetical protein
MKKLRMIITAALAVAFLGAFSLPTEAVHADVASGKVDLGAGSGIKFGTVASNSANPLDTAAPINTCTLSAIGYDQYDNLVGISVGHCPYNTENTLNDSTWAQVSGQKDGALGQVGTVVKRAYTVGGSATSPDYSVIQFDKTKVNPLSTVGNTTLYGISTTLPGLFSNVCKEGRTTAQTCGIVVGTSSTYFDSMAFAAGGDSGAPVVKTGDGKLAGYLVGSAGLPYVSASRYKFIQPVLTAINTAGGVGSGFHL